MLQLSFFDQKPLELARALLGKVIRRKWKNHWLSVRIIETEAYSIEEKASHSSLGCTPSRKALFSKPGTIYMYYARGSASLNIVCNGEGNAVLIKSGFPVIDKRSPEKTIQIMKKLNPRKSDKKYRELEELCSGQTLLCKSIGLSVEKWNHKQFIQDLFFIEETEYKPQKIIQARRLGIPKGRDEHLLYRFIDVNFANHATENPERKKNWVLGKDYRYLA